MPKSEPLLKTWQQEEKQPFSGWDFSYLAGRMIEDRPPWDYPARAAELMNQSRSVLDMGTGGGERLLAMQEAWPEKVVVTEDYRPNVALARERLGPLGVEVVDVPLSLDDLLPFADGEFELVLNRHSGFNAAEVARVLAPGGTFFTQQVHGLWAQDLLAIFDARPQWPDAVPSFFAPRLTEAGLQIETAEDWQGRLRFLDVGAIVYYLKAVPWLVPGFTVERYTAQLLALQTRLENEGELIFQARLYLIEARKIEAERKSNEDAMS